MLPLFVSDVSLLCINEAAVEYRIPAKLIVAVLHVERGKAGIKHRNANGSYDLGPMQINTSWWPRLYRYGITPAEVLNDACINVRVGAWILAQSVADGHTLLSGIGDYNSHTPRFNQFYQQQVRIRYTLLTKALDA